MPSQIEENCRLCGAPNIKNLFRTSSWGISFCRSCTNAWTEQPSIGTDRVNYEEIDFHSSFRFKGVSDMPYQWRKAVVMQVKLLERYIPRGSNILEIGCGEGLFLHELSKRGFRVFGVEPSRTASEHARISGLNVIQGYFPDIHIPGYYQAVVMSQVLEHIQNPISFLNHAGALVQDGHILLVQTNWKGLMPRIYKKDWYAWVPEQHYWHFTPKGLRIILKRLNWQITKIEYSSLSHGNHVLSLIAPFIPGFGDQFHMLAKIPRRQPT
jgi:2-polyprenyl-3-methyl-5-hydroxy-6-metoxy-1,4-benzoquinol methylase